MLWWTFDFLSAARPEIAGKGGVNSDRYSFPVVITFHMNERLVSNETMVSHRLRGETLKFGLKQIVGSNFHWSRDSEADASSFSPPSVSPSSPLSD